MNQIESGVGVKSGQFESLLREHGRRSGGQAEMVKILGNRWARDVTAQAFEFMALIHGAAHLGMQAKALRV